MGSELSEWRLWDVVVEQNCMAVSLSKIDYLDGQCLVVQLDNPLQTSLEHLLPSRQIYLVRI
jgi:hypothetical protein